MYVCSLIPVRFGLVRDCYASRLVRFWICRSSLADPEICGCNTITQISAIKKHPKTLSVMEICGKFSWSIWSDLGRVQQLTTLIGRSIGPAYVRPVSYDSYHRYPIEQNGSDSLPTAGRRHTTYLTTDSVFYWLTKIYVYRSETLTTHYKYLNSQIQPNSNCEHDVTWPGARESAFALTIDPWNLAMAASCPTADRSRKMAQNRGPVSCWTCSCSILLFAARCA